MKIESENSKPNIVNGTIVRAMYNANVKNNEQLDFKEGDTIAIQDVLPDDDFWMKGYLLKDPTKKGLVPRTFVKMDSRNQESLTKGSKCKACIDCKADEDDELSFKKGDIIVITEVITDDNGWIEGFLENDPLKKCGIFPVSYVSPL